MDLNVPSSMSFKPHPMHGVDRSWPETNCYTDLWIELLAHLGMIPEACFGFAIGQDFGSDQFTFSKPPLPDLELLYGLKVRELSLYKSLEYHAALHTGQRNIILLEVDAFYLPDTFATTYRQDHGKTTIAIDHVNVRSRSCHYFHNAARGELSGDDYIGVFQLQSDDGKPIDKMYPYMEVVERPTSLKSGDKLRKVATEIFRDHFAKRPIYNPFTMWRQAFDRQLEALLINPNFFHDYAFHFPRMAGANFETLSSHINWISEEQLQCAVSGCQNIAKIAKTFQYRIARSVARRKIDLADDCFDLLEHNYSNVVDALGSFLC